jgi:hypothetical protein
MIATETSDHRSESLATFGGKMSQSLKVGDLVGKRAGAVRYVVEADHPGFAERRSN